jgi:oxaloacetate decarboxylase gamma subunit
MSELDLMREGLALMVCGMGFVVIFLLVLVFALHLMSGMVTRFSPAPAATPVPPAPDTLAHLRPVIAAALHHHRRLHGIH